MAMLLPPPGVPADLTVQGVHVRVLAVDLRAPDTVLDLVLADPKAGDRAPTGDAPFSLLVAKAHAAAVVNGTYFSMDARRSVMGTMVRAGTLVNHVAFRPRGTTFGLLAGNRPELLPAARADWRRHWLSITAGPRLLTDGAVKLQPREEGFFDPSVLGVATRTAIGYTRDSRTLLVASFHTPVGLAKEAAVMRALGAWQAMNLDGGTCRALAEHGKPTVRPGRNLTNAIALYDAAAPAPAALKTRFRAFVANRQAPLPLVVDGLPYDCGPFACGRRTPDVAVAARPYDFEGWLFSRASGRPVVYNHDGWLHLSGGALRTPMPGQAGTFSVLARLTGPTLTIGWGRNLRLALTPDAATLTAGARKLAGARWPLGRDRHMITFTPRGGRLDVTIDGRLTLSAEAAGAPGVLTLDGAGAFQGFSRPTR